MKYLLKIVKTIKISFSLAKTDFTLRVEGSYLGIFWYLLNPLAMFLVLILIKKYNFSNTEISNYPIYLFMGIIGFNFFKQVLSNSIKSISSNTKYIKSINNIPMEVLVVSSVIQAVFSHFFEFILIAGFIFYYKISLIGLLFYPLLFLFFILFILGVSFIFATIGMYLNDLDNVWSIVSQLLFFITPIFHVIETGSPIYFINLLNPLYYFLTLARSIVINMAIPPLWMIAVMLFICPLMLIFGISIFNRFKDKFVELV